MNARKKIAVAVAGAMACALTSLSAPASAAPSDATAGGTAPACVYRYVTGSGSTLLISITNQCGKTMRVQVVIAWDYDSDCYVIPDRKNVVVAYSGTGSYDRLAVC
ncbi:hypothetical protein ABZ669_38080 [Streptomyces hirsutus]|uniref:hypothetical protein n=1 Tax=Streptomyces hirsutus TaxID=35620 RepID=UPI003410D9B8